MNRLFPPLSSLRWTVAGAFLALGVMSLAGCGGGGDAKTTNDNGPVTASGQKDSASGGKGKKKSATLSKVKFKDGNGKSVFSLKFRKDGAKLVDGNEQEIARYTVSGRKLKIKDADDNVLGYLVSDGKKIKVEDASQKVMFFKLQQQDDGDWKLEDRKDNLVYRIKKRDYGFEVETPDDKRHRKVKNADGKKSLRNAQEKTIYSTRDDIKAMAVACLGCDAIQDIRIRFGLAVLIQNQTDDW